VKKDDRWEITSYHNRSSRNHQVHGCSSPTAVTAFLFLDLCLDLAPPQKLGPGYGIASWGQLAVPLFSVAASSRSSAAPSPRYALPC
jgi:hypothetical protein